MTDFLKLFKHNLKQNMSFNIAFIISSIFVMSVISMLSLFIFKKKLLNYSVNSTDSYSNYKELLSSAYNFPLKILLIILLLFIALSIIRNYYNTYYGEGSSFVIGQLPISRLNHRLSIYFETVLLMLVIIILMNLGMYINIKIQESIYRGMMVVNPNLITNTMASSDISNLFQEQVPIFSINIKDFIYEILFLWPMLVSSCALQVLLFKIFKKRILFFYGLIAICVLYSASISGIFIPLVFFEKIVLGGLNISNVICDLIILLILYCTNFYLYNNKYEL